MTMTKEDALETAKCKDPTANLFIVRLYDGMDGEWMDVTEPLSAEEAMAIWDRNTEGGTKKISYNEIDYYAIYPATVKMVFSDEGVGPQNR
jgi:hypothetical protein